MKCDACSAPEAHYDIVAAGDVTVVAYICRGCLLLLLPNKLNPMPVGKSPGEETMNSDA